MRWRPLTVLALLLAAWAMGAAQAQVKAEDVPLEEWAVGVLAADWRASDGTPIEAFENARRDLTRAFGEAGFDPVNIADLSLRPRWLGGTSLVSELAFAAIASRAQSAKAGCLLYFTSHGSPEGIVLGSEGLLSPLRMAALVNEWCGERPTVVVVSACYSGVFVPALAAPNRMVMTAARPDRSSFGCSADSDYPYFDACVIKSLPTADDFVHLASMTRRCVAFWERAENLMPPSEPLVDMGADVEDLFVFLNFERPAP